MLKRQYSILVLLVLVALMAAQCGGAATPAATEAKPAAAAMKVGLVTDIGGVNDKSFNQSAWAGVQKAAKEFGMESKFIESKQPTDYEKNIDQFATEKYDVIITVGFLMGDATAAKALQYPNIKFAIIDQAYYPTKGAKVCDDTKKDCYADGGLKNVTSLMFQEDEVGFLAGVAAAGMSKSGTICSVAGMEIPPVVRYVVGYQAGSKWYKPATKALNVYIPSFTDPAKGKEVGQSMIGQGCDVVFGVGGNTGNGGLLAAKEKGLLAIGVDVDQYNTYPEVKDSLLTSAMKNVDTATYEFLKSVKDGSVKPGINMANIKNGGVGLAPYHDLDSKVPAELKTKVQEAVDGLKSGAIATGYQSNAPASSESSSSEASSAPASSSASSEASSSEASSAVSSEASSAAAAVSDIGTAAHPIKVLFVPSVDAGMIVSGGEIMSKALEAATGLKFEVSVPTSYAATVEATCASPTDTIAFIPALGYVIANQKCGVEVGAAAVRKGWSVYWAEFLVARDSNITSIKDLAGKKWAIPDRGSASGFLYPSVALKDAGVEPGEIIEAGGHPQAVLALYNGEVDFATAFFSPPILKPDWKIGDNPEPYDFNAVKLVDKKAMAGDVEVLDARINTLETAPDVFKKVKILTLTDPIPNDTISFSPDFPPALRTKIVDALTKFMATPECKDSLCNTKFYGWTGVEPTKDGAYDIVRKLIKTLGYTEDDIFKKK
jgi:phosphate/phosphite/phosphonate ABC transporter binding protein